MWFTFVTVTTVGYGDYYPTTWRGQVFCAVVILCGVIFLAMPLSIVGTTFASVWEERNLLRLQKHIRQRLSLVDMRPDDVVAAFKRFDKDGNGKVRREAWRERVGR